MKHILSSSTKGAQIFLLTSLLAIPIAIMNYGWTLKELGLVLLGYFLYGCLGVVITFHRYLTHKSFETHPIIIKFFSILGCFSGTGSPLAWVAIHLNHHLKSDKPDDPHSPLYKGVKIFTLNYVESVNVDTKWRMRHLVTDKFQQFLHRYYFLINLTYSTLLFTLGGMHLVIFFHWAPAALTAIMSNVVNYVGHTPNWIGSFRSYNIHDQSSNNWLWAIPSWGEAWHNNHHRFPKNSYFGQQWWEVDISGLIIKLIKTK
jgi:stearoyl-CoA desaturase (delta-9 desaturase)